MKKYNVCVLGGGPAGLAAAVSAADEGASVLIIEREAKLGGILKQCIHDGFGLLRFGERLTGPEYSGRYIEMMESKKIDYITQSFVIDAEKSDDGFQLTVQSADGMKKICSDTIVIACGCREKTARQVMIQGTRPAGIYSAGTAQYFVNIMGYMPTKKCVILGSGDIGMIMARRLTLEGAQVEGVYEIKDAPCGLARNVAQCLNDYDIPLHLSTTVTNIYGEKRVEAVDVCQVNPDFSVKPETKRTIECDALILSVGLLPENEIAEKLGVKLDPATKGAYVDQCFMTTVPGIFSCGNALHVNDLVDYVSESGELAGKNAAHYDPAGKRSLVDINYDKKKLLYLVPQYFDNSRLDEPVSFYFRARDQINDVKVTFALGQTTKEKKYKKLVPSEMETVKLKAESEITSADVSTEALS
jgi:thioredoxin reductase